MNGVPLDTAHLHRDVIDWLMKLGEKLRSLRIPFSTVRQQLAGVARQIDAGGVPEDSEKFRVFNRNLDAFKMRNEGELPLEIALNNVVDEVFDKLFGKSPFAKLCMENYALSIREKESVSMEREAEELEKRALAIREEIALRDSGDQVTEPPAPISIRPAKESNLPNLA
jgi:hypothetical protein